MSESERVEPEAYHVLSPEIEVLCYGARHDWAIRGDKSPEGAEAANPGLLRRLEAAITFGGWSGDIYMPNPSRANAQVSWPNESWKYVNWHAGPNARILRGPFADGVVLESANQAFAITSADCPTVVLWDPEDPTGRVVAAHAGRDSLIDRAMLRGEGSLDNHALIWEMVKYLSPKDASQVRAYIACGIGPAHFPHPENDPVHGRTNARMTFFITFKWGAGCFQGPPREGRLRLDELIRCQLAEEGVDPTRVITDGVDTYTDLHADGQYRWHSHRRDGVKAGRSLLVFRRR